MDIRTAIIKIRNDNDLSQQSFADMLDVSRTTVARWESGKSIPSSAQIMKICRVFNLDSNELFGVSSAANSEEKPKKERTLNKFALIYILFGVLIFVAVIGVAITVYYAVKDAVYDTVATVWTMTIPKNTPLIVLAFLLLIFIALLVILLTLILRGKRK